MQCFPLPLTQLLKRGPAPPQGLCYNPYPWCTTKSFLDGAFPISWNTQIIHPIFKDGDEMDCNNYRGISVAPVLAKLYAMVLEARISRWAESNDVRAACQAGFRSKYRTTDHLFTLQTIIDKATAHKITLYCCFVDFKKAFDSVPRELLWQRISEAGIHGTMLSALKSMYVGVNARVSTPEGLTDSFGCDMGVKQGCPLSPLLFGLYIDRLEPLIHACQGCPPALHGLPVPMLLYADDLVLISTSPQGLQTQLDTLHSFCEASDLHVNLTKTDVVMFGKKPGGFPHWIFNGAPVPIKTEYKYLGLTFQSKHGLSRCVQKLTTAGQRALHAMYKRCHELQLDVPSIMCSLFDSLVRPVLSYGCEVWSPYPSPCTVREKPEVLHRRFLKRCAGVAEATPSDIVYGEFGRTPLQVFWRRLTERYLERLQSQEDGSILGSAYLESEALYQAGHQSWAAHYHRQTAAEGWVSDWELRLAKGGSSTIQAYSNIKSGFGAESYLSDLAVARQHRIALARLRMGSHWLGTQLGIYARAAERKRMKSIPCRKCNVQSSTSDNPILLCDHCDSGWHLTCLDGTSTLSSVPDDSWFCPPCVAAGTTSPEALDASNNRLATVVMCPQCGETDDLRHAIFDCCLYTAFREQHQALFSEHDRSLAGFFSNNADKITELGEFVYKCYKSRQALTPAS